MADRPELYTLEGNAFFAAAFGILLPVQIYLGIRHRTWGFLIGMFAGLLFEVLGYVSRIQMHFGEKKFLTYIVTITIGPAFFSAAIYLCLARIVIVYGRQLSRLPPAVITTTFMILDAFALGLQAAGGATAGGDGDPAKRDRGLTILQAGLSVHLAGIVIYVLVCADLAWQIWRRRDEWDLRFDALQRSTKWRAFLIGLGVATLCILIRTAFRVAELREGFESDISQNETIFFVLEGAMILAAGLILTICHPGIAFQGRWAEANFSFSRSKQRRHDAKGLGIEERQGGHVALNSM
ncbi:RTA1 like protein [Sarocladium implicatum]|nr:RTA1 like protein [Sarocladium implicatum]